VRGYFRTGDVITVCSFAIAYSGNHLLLIMVLQKLTSSRNIKKNLTQSSGRVAVGAVKLTMGAEKLAAPHPDCLFLLNKCPLKVASGVVYTSSLDCRTALLFKILPSATNAVSVSPCKLKVALLVHHILRAVNYLDNC
jgi:hypothetical protein